MPPQGQNWLRGKKVSIQEMRGDERAEKTDKGPSSQHQDLHSSGLCVFSAGDFAATAALALERPSSE
jgi:hypothetical protein